MGRWARKPVNHTSWVAVVTSTDRPKSVRNRCLIELFCGVVCAFTLPFWHFRGCRGFCHRTESDLLLFVLILSIYFPFCYFKLFLFWGRGLFKENHFVCLNFNNFDFLITSSTVVLYCWCHSDSASVLLYFTFKYWRFLYIVNPIWSVIFLYFIFDFFYFVIALCLIFVFKFLQCQMLILFIILLSLYLFMYSVIKKVS